MTKSRDAREDFIGRLHPHERGGVFVRDRCIEWPPPTRAYCGGCPAELASRPAAANHRSTRLTHDAPVGPCRGTVRNPSRRAPAQVAENRDDTERGMGRSEKTSFRPTKQCRKAVGSLVAELLGDRDWRSCRTRTSVPIRSSSAVAKATRIVPPCSRPPGARPRVVREWMFKP